MPQIERSKFAVLWLHLGFAATGFGTTLLGCLLPTLHTTWNIDDSRAGVLFACQFTGASLGALLVGKNFFRSLERGYMLLVVSAALLGVVSSHASAIVFFVFGLGLGWAMTATSMMTGTVFERSGAALSLLNASWVIGAVLSPEIASAWVRRWPPTSIFFVVAIVMAAIALLLLPHRRSLSQGPAPGIAEIARTTQWALIVGFSLLAFLYVGIEVSVSGWMMTYVHRLPSAGIRWAALITSCFWMALLCGRLVAPAILLHISETALFLAAMLAAFVSLFLLLFSHAPGAVLLAASCAGLALAPVFPLCASRALALTHRSPQTKWVFAIAGLGGAALPWMTGKLSAASGSLREGLFVPLCALGAMLLLFLLIARRNSADRKSPQLE